MATFTDEPMLTTGHVLATVVTTGEISGRYAERRPFASHYAFGGGQGVLRILRESIPPA